MGLKSGRPRFRLPASGRLLLAGMLSLFAGSVKSYSYDSCSATCYSYDCDYWSSYTCAVLEGTYGCDCSGCACANDRPEPPAPPAPPPYSPLPPYSPGTSVVGTVDELTTALGDASVGRIALSEGTYGLTAQLTIDRNVSLEAAVAGTVVLDGMGASRVLSTSGGAVVELAGLHITGGYSYTYVRLPPSQPHSHPTAQ